MKLKLIKHKEKVYFLISANKKILDDKVDMGRPWILAQTQIQVK